MQEGAAVRNIEDEGLSRRLRRLAVRTAALTQLAEVAAWSGDTAEATRLLREAARALDSPLLRLR